MTKYFYRNAIGGFFELPTEAARRLIPAHLEPVELRHGVSILNILAFDFHESDVGAFGEVLMSVTVAPLVRPGEKQPRSAFFPYRIATTTAQARDYAVRNWHLPHWMSNVDITFEPGPHRLTVMMNVDGASVIEMTISDYSWKTVSHPYQAFTMDGTRPCMAQLSMQGDLSEHEEEVGRLKLHPHAFLEGVAIGDINPRPFRELWMRNGLQTIQPLITL